jgi:hypothetical protein
MFENFEEVEREMNIKRDNMPPILIKCQQCICPVGSIKVDDISESEAVENEEFVKSDSTNSVSIQEIDNTDGNSASELISETSIYPLKVSGLSANPTGSKIQLLKHPKCKFQNIQLEMCEDHMKTHVNKMKKKVHLSNKSKIISDMQSAIK